MPCATTKTAIIVYGKRSGTKLTVCTAKRCPVHDPQTAAEQAANPAPIIAPAPITETEAEREERETEYEQRRKEHEQEQRRREEERKQQFEREQAEYEAKRTRREALHKERQATFERILEHAPAMFTATQLRVFLRALVNLHPYDFAEDVAAYYIGDDENYQQTPGGGSGIGSHQPSRREADELRPSSCLDWTHRHSTRSDSDFLAEAEAVFIPPQPKNNRRATNQLQ